MLYLLQQEHYALTSQPRMTTYGPYSTTTQSGPVIDSVWGPCTSVLHDGLLAGYTGPVPKVLSTCTKNHGCQCCLTGHSGHNP